MEAVQKTHWYLLVLVLSLLLLRDSEQRRAPDARVSLEEGMVLDCSCPWSGKLILVAWTKDSDSRPLAVFHPELGVNFAEAYEGRVEFLQASDMDGSIALTKVTEQDQGLYHCNMQTFPQGSWAKDTRVEKQVISPNSSHHPETELIVAQDESLTLRCSLSHRDAVLRVSLEKLVGPERGSEGGAGEVLAECSVQDGVLELNTIVEHGKVNCSEDLELRLLLSNVSEEDGGVYRCNFTTHTGVRSSTVLLKTRSTLELGVNQDVMLMYGVVGAAVFIVLTGLLLLLLWLSRRKRGRSEFGASLHPNTRRKNAYERGGEYDRMRKNKRRNSPIYANIHTVQAYKKRQR